MYLGVDPIKIFLLEANQDTETEGSLLFTVSVGPCDSVRVKDKFDGVSNNDSQDPSHTHLR